MKQSVSPVVAVIIIVVVIAIVAAAVWKLTSAKGKGASQKPSGTIDPDEMKAKRAGHKGGGPPIGPDGKTPAGGTPPMGGAPMAKPDDMKGGGVGEAGKKGLKGSGRPGAMRKRG